MPNSARTTTCAVVEYTKALQLKPERRRTRGSASIARSCGPPQDHFQRGRRLAATGKFEEALVEYELAAELNPTSGDGRRRARDRRGPSCAPRSRSSREGKTELQTLIERARDLPPPGLDLPPDVKMPTSLIFRDASSRDVFLTSRRFANISIAFDPAFRESPVTIDLRNASLEDALNAGRRRDAHVLPRHGAAHRHRHSRHAGQAPRVRGRSRPDLLFEQRRSQGDDGSAAARARRCAASRRPPRPTR